jgi:hypothetical protein
MNVSVAAAILIFEAKRQRGFKLTFFLISEIKNKNIQNYKYENKLSSTTLSGCVSEQNLNRI